MIDIDSLHNTASLYGRSVNPALFMSESRRYLLKFSRDPNSLELLHFSCFSAFSITADRTVNDLFQSVRYGCAILEYCSLDKSEEPVVPLLQCCLGKCKKKSHSEDGSKASTSSFTLEESIRVRL